MNIVPILNYSYVLGPGRNFILLYGSGGGRVGSMSWWVGLGRVKK